jgi:hypothetical protein
MKFCEQLIGDSKWVMSGFKKNPSCRVDLKIYTYLSNKTQLEKVIPEKRVCEVFKKKNN